MRAENETENLIAEHLEVFRDSLQLHHHAGSESKSCCIKLDSIFVEIDFSSFVSSAKRYVVQNEIAIGMSFMKI